MLRGRRLKQAWQKPSDRASHLKVLSLYVGITKPCPLLQQAAAQVSGVHVEVPTQQNHICTLGGVATGGEQSHEEESVTLPPFNPSPHPTSPVKPRLTHWMNWASSQAWATRCAR